MASKRKLEALESGVDAVYSETQLIQINNINPVSSPPNKLPTGYSGKLPIINPILPAVISPPIKAPSKGPTPIPPSKGPTPIPPGKGPSNVNGTNTASKSVTTKNSVSPDLSGQKLLHYLHALLPTNTGSLASSQSSGYTFTQNGTLLYNGNAYTGVYPGNGVTYNNGIAEIGHYTTGTSSEISTNESDN